MKHSKVWAPVPLRRVSIREKTKIGEYLIADSLPAIVGLVQMGVLELHTWNSRCARIEEPDRIVIDIDPGASIGWPAVVEAARLIRSLLRTLGLESFVKTTGGRGLHVVVPLAPRADWSACLAFARAMADTLARQDPARYTTRFAKAGREGKILIDYLRNNRTNTSVAAFSTRARPAAPVSVPLTWNELTPARTPDRFTIETVPRRLSRLRADPWAEYWRTTQTIPPGAIPALARL
jgi:bifunctional non-homologous end joining protein LigD